MKTKWQLASANRKLFSFNLLLLVPTYFPFSEDYWVRVTSTTNQISV